MTSEDEDPPSAKACTAFGDYLRRRETEPDTDFEDFCRLRPEIAGELESLKAQWEVATDLFERLGTSPSLADRLKSTFGEAIDLDISLSSEGTEDESSSSSTRVIQRLAQSGGFSKSYQHRGIVARGGMGAILNVWDEDLRRTLAMKVVLGHDEEPGQDGTPKVGNNQLIRFLEEAQITGQLDHPGILPVHDLGIDDNGRVYFTMPLVRGQTLKEIFELARAGEQEWNTAKALGVLIKVCEAMGFAHSKAVIHRDLKPANIMVGRFGETYVMDWGLAKVMGRRESRAVRRDADVGSSMSLVKTDRRDDAASDPDSPLITLDGDVVGTPTYMSPEQARGMLAELSPQSDVYAVGAMLYQLLTGRAPYHEPDSRISLHTVLARVLEGPPKPIEEIDKNVVPELTAICEKAMAREAEDRYKTMLGLAEDMRAFLEGHVVRAYESGTVAEFRKWVSRNRMGASFIAISVFLTIGGLLAFIIQQDQSRENLQLQNEALEDANAAISAQRDRAEEQEREADRQRGRAESMVEIARRQSYLGNIRAADSSLKLYQTVAAKEMLASCEDELRGWEWRYLSAKSSAQSTEFHLPDGLSSSRVTADGQLILCCSADRRLLMWDPDLNEVVAGFADAKTSNYPPAFAVSSPDGSKLYSLNFGGRLWIWDSFSGALLDNIYAHRPYAVFALEQDRSGKRLATAGQDRVIFLWDTESMEVVASIPSSVLASSLAFAPDGESLAIGYRDGRVAIWSISELEAASGEEQQVPQPLMDFRAHQEPITSLAWSSDGTRLASASEDTSARIWSVETGKSSMVLSGHSQAVTAICFHPDGRLVATGSADDTIRLWDLESGIQVDVLLGHVGDIHSLGFRKAGAQLVSGAKDDTVRIWDLERSTVSRRFSGHDDEINGLSFSPDGSILATASADRTIRLWNARNGRVTDTLSGHTRAVTAIAFTPDGRRIISGSADQSVRIWDANTSRSLRALRGHTQRVLSVTCSPDGKRIASAGGDKQIRIWDASSGASRAQLEGHRKSVNALAFGRDSNQLISGSSDNTVRIWEIDTLQYEELIGHTDDVLSVAASPDGRLIASGSKDRTARVWDSATGALIGTFEGHNDSVVAVAFQAEGAHLVTASNDGTLRIWDVALGAQLLAIESGATFRAMALYGDRVAAAGTIDSADTVRAEVWLWEARDQ